MTEPVVLLDATRGGVAVVTLNRPAHDNAFNGDVVGSLIEIVEELKGADGVRVVILEAAGTNFSSGTDAEWLRFVTDYTFDDNLSDARDMRHLLTAFQSLPKVTIATVQGAAVGLAAGLIAAADIAIADRSAFFSFPDARLGISPAVVLPSLIGAIGARAARRYVLTGERIEAAEAHRLGLIQAIAEDRQGLAALSEALVAALFQGAPQTLAATKLLIDAVKGDPGDPHLTHDLARHYAESLASEEGEEGLAAFLAGRKPKWAE